MPRPRTSICPAIASGTDAMTRPPAAASTTRSSATSAAAGSPSRSASSSDDLPLPDAPRMRTPRLADERRRWHGRVAGRAHAAGQADGEAGAEDDRRLAGLLARPRAVLGPDAAVMRLDDLLGDRQAEAGILAEGLRPGRRGRCRSARRCARTGRGGCRDRRPRRRPRRRPCAARATTRTTPSLRQKERALSIRLLKTWPRRLSWPRTK